MHTELGEIKRLRNKLGLTQKELAGLACVSQSLVAKIESGKLDPAYSKVRKLFEALESFSDKSEVKAEEVMTDRIICVSKDAKIKEIVEKMRKHGISQVPVCSQDRTIGLVSEATIINELSEGKTLDSLRMEDVMQEAPPIVSKNTPARIVLELLRYSPLVMISDNEKLKGVITKADVLRKYR